jgi:hypothetical protein
MKFVQNGHVSVQGQLFHGRYCNRFGCETFSDLTPVEDVDNLMTLMKQILRLKSKKNSRNTTIIP